MSISEHKSSGRPRAFVVLTYIKILLIISLDSAILQEFEMKKILQRVNQVPYLNPAAYFVIGVAGFLILIYGVYNLSVCTFLKCYAPVQFYQGLIGFCIGLVGFGLAMRRFFFWEEQE